MRVRSVKAVRESVRAFDLTVNEHHTVALANGVVVSNCDVHCYGKSCGACDHKDLRLRTRYIQAAQRERQTDLVRVRSLDQRTQTVRIRARLHRPEVYRYVGNEHWRFAIRRAAFRAQADLNLSGGIAKRSIRFASDHIKGKDWSWGVDYVEFGIHRTAVGDIDAFIDAMNFHLIEWTHLDEWVTHSATAASLRADVGLTLYYVEVAGLDLAAAQARLGAWHAAERVEMKLPVQGGYFAPASETVDAKSFVDDLWLVRDGHRLGMQMLVRTRPSIYHLYGAVMDRPGLVDTLRIPARRMETFLAVDRTQQDFLRPNCLDCGLQIPVSVLDQPYSPERCPHCLARYCGITVEPADRKDTS